MICMRTHFWRFSDEVLQKNALLKPGMEEANEAHKAALAAKRTELLALGRNHKHEASIDEDRRSKKHKKRRKGHSSDGDRGKSRDRSLMRRCCGVVTP